MKTACHTKRSASRRGPRKTPGTTAPVATLLAAWLILSGGPALRAAEDAPGQVWLISTRAAPAVGNVDPEAARFDYWRMGPDRQWLSSDRSALLASDDPDVPTTFYIHGNRADRNKAICQSWPVYRCLQQRAAGRHFRFVIWSWPADQVRGPARLDLGIKAARSDTQAYYLAWQLDRLRPDVPVTLVGYSFGARVISGALHILGGGQIAGNALPERLSPRRRPIRTVLVAAAIDSDWFLPGHRNDRALDQVERLLVTRNDRDRALRLYRWMRAGRRGTRAMGSLGPASLAALGSARQKIRLIGVGGFVGRVHDWRSYLNAPGLRSQLPSYAFLDPAEERVSPDGPILAEVSGSSDQSPTVQN